MEIKFIKRNFNQTMEDRIRNTKIKFEPGVDEIKNDIQKSRFGHVMGMREERLPKPRNDVIMQILDDGCR